jgi:acetyl esterase/lipase
MMTGWLLFTFSAFFVALGLLTVFKAPEWVDWRLAAFVGQYGHAIAVIPLVAGLLALFLPGSRGAPAIAASLAAAVGFALLLNPCIQAWIIGRGLPGKLERQFGRAAIAGPAFSFGALFQRQAAPVPKVTWVYSGTLQLDFYPAIGRLPAPCVIVIHGGGWDDGSRDQIPQLDDWLARGGYAVAAISYRLAPEAIWPAQREDVAAAIAFVKARAVELGVDPTKLVLLGRSAGGQIAEACAYGFRDPAVRGVIALYAPADMNFAYEWSREDDVLKSPTLLRKFLGGTPETAAAAYNSASGILLVGPGSPPTLLVHGTIDTLVWHKQSERLASRLQEAGVPHVLVSLPWATHALEFNPGGPSGQLTLFAVKWYLAAVCR